MTTVLNPPSSNVFFPENGEWDLPAAEVTPDVIPDEAVPESNKPSPGVCVACNEPIVREPGARGRLPKYHPDCRPLKEAAGSKAPSRRNNRAEAEADELIATFKNGMVKLALAVSMVDKFDAFCIMVMTPNLASQLRGVLIRYDGARKQLLELKGEGSIVGLIITLVMGVAPIAAHHGLIPNKGLTNSLTNLPGTMWKLQQKMEQGTAGLTKLMEEQLEAQKAAAEASRKKDGPVEASA